MYKYISDVQIENVLFKNTLRFTQPSQFNDPFECTPVLKGISTRESLSGYIDENKAIEMAIESIRNTDVSSKFKSDLELRKVASDFYYSNKELLFNATYKGSEEIAQSSVQEGIKSGVNKGIGVLCLTENRCDHLMWAHYANDHKGMLVKFNTDFPFFNQQRSVDDLCYKFDKVEYFQERKEQFLVDLERAAILYQKNHCWAYENEWRVARPLVSLNEVKSGVFVASFDWDIIREIVFGVNCNTETKKHTISHMRSVAPHVEIREAILSNKQYEIFYELCK